jgi:pyruvate dehydrogenase E2 component (dihydrolipoamide acetyltransferase)
MVVDDSTLRFTRRNRLWGADPSMANAASRASATGSGRSVPLEMPRLSSDEGTATLSAWLVAVGDRVEKGAIVAELETDKATVELESPVEGQVEALVVAAGTEGLKPGVLLARFVPSATVTVTERPTPSNAPPTSPTDADRKPTPPTATAAAAAAAPAPAPRSPVAAVPVENAIRSVATPLARRVAEARGIDLDRVTGTGVGGRIEKADVERTGATPSANQVPAREAADTRAVRPQSGLAEAPRAPAHLGLRCRMEAILAARARLNGTAPAAAGASAAADEAGRGGITLNDFVVRAAALALRDVPAANLRRIGAGVERAEAIDVALVAGTDAGPVPVVLRDADRKGLAVLSKETRALVEAARAGGRPESGDAPASLLITSFARFGIETASPMLPADQVCVLAVGTVIEEPIVEAGAVAIGKTLALTLAFDPTAVGGAVAAPLLAAIRVHLEDPLSMML